MASHRLLRPAKYKDTGHAPPVPVAGRLTDWTFRVDAWSREDNPGDLDVTIEGAGLESGPFADSGHGIAIGAAEGLPTQQELAVAELDPWAWLRAAWEVAGEGEWALSVEAEAPFFRLADHADELSLTEGGSQVLDSEAEMLAEAAEADILGWWGTLQAFDTSRPGFFDAMVRAVAIQMGHRKERRDPTLASWTRGRRSETYRHGTLDVDRRAQDVLRPFALRGRRVRLVP